MNFTMDSVQEDIENESYDESFTSNNDNEDSMPS